MLDWLLEAFPSDVTINLRILATQLTAALVLGCVVAGIYRLTQGKANGQATALMATLVLLTVLISAVTLVIGENTARAFSLVGALAIIRFRTVVEDTRDTAFVIFAVAQGMAVGAGFLTIPLMVIPFAAAAAFLFRPRATGALHAPLDFLLTVRIGVGHNPEALLREPFAKHLERSRLAATTTARQGAAFDVTYAVRLRRDAEAVALVAALNGIEGVQNVELRSA